MALRIEEILRCKAELQYNIVGVGAEVYIADGYIAVFDRAVAPYLIDIGTTSATTITAVSTPTVVAVTLASNPLSPQSTQALAFVPGSSVVVDVGPMQETSVILSITGLVALMQLSLGHGASAPFPVLLQGAEQFVRDVFARIDVINGEMRSIAPKTAGIQQADEIKIYGSQRGRTGTRNKIDDLLFQRDEARRDLAALLGVPYLKDVRRGGRGGGAIELY